MEKRVISTQVQEEDMQTEFSLRPMSLEEYVGQEKNKKHVACIYRGGMSTTGTVGSCAVFTVRRDLGKTTLSGIIANEMGVHMKITSGPAIDKARRDGFYFK